MTRISKRIIGWVLGALAFVALACGIIMARPQIKTAKAADTAVTFSAATLGDESDATYGTSIRFDTSGLQWETYHNWVSATDWASIADYTTVNGRTVTEINNATTNEQKITLMMQPAGSFSFLRLYIPEGIMATSDVKSMGIMDGWSFNNGTNNYTSSAVTFFRTGDTMLEESTYAASKTTIDSSSITIADATLTNPTNAGWGVDSYYVDIDLGMQVTGEYDAMYSGGKYARQAIYINGKSIEEWNTQKIAEDSRFADPSSYTRFPQNSTTDGHPEYFAKPVGLWCTDTGFRVSIYQELVADCETVTVTVGEGCYFSSKFMVVENVSKTVLTQSVVDITDKLTFMDNSHNAPASWGATNYYYIHTNNEACWTKAPWGGCLNEYDPAAAGGGQIQMKYVTFNGSTLWDINKGDDGTYESTQDNIASGSIYAPILAMLTAEVGSSIRLTVPTAFTNGKDGHEEIVIKKGFNVAENGVSYYVTNDVVFTNTDSGWTKEIKGNEIATEVTGIITKANRTDGGNNENFVIFQLSNNDYTGCNTTAITDISSLYGYIDIGGNVVSSQPVEPFFNVWNIQNSVAFRAPGLDAAALQNVTYITIKAGAKFPSYNTQYNGGVLTYYVTSEDITFIHDVPNDTWTVGEAPGSEPEEPTIETSVKGIVTDAGYIGIELTESDYANADTEYTADLSSLVGYIDIGGTVMSTTPATSTAWYSPSSDSTWPNSIVFIAPGFSGGYESVEYITIKEGAKFPAYANVTSSATTYYVTTADITFYKHSDGTWQTTEEQKEIDITSVLTIADQGNLAVGTETYLIKTPSLYWTGLGCLNSVTGGDELLKHIYFNGTSIYDINADDDGNYGSEQGNIASGGVYAPILVYLSNDAGKYSFIQIHVPTGYPNMDLTAEGNHQSIEIKSSFTYTEGTSTWFLSDNVKFINLNGSWVNEDNTFAADTVTIGNPRIDGTAKELYKVDITSSSWNITCNAYDFMYGNDYATYRKFIFINGVSVYDINANTDDSNYTYSTFPMTGADDATFAHPVLVESRYQHDSDPNTITLWIHKDYINSLGENITITLGAGYNAYTGGLVLAENVDYDMIANVTIDNGTRITTSKMVKGANLATLGTPIKYSTETTMYEFIGWYISDTETQLDETWALTEDISLEARFSETEVSLIETEVNGITHYLKTTTDNWLAFEISEHDYTNASDNHSMGGYEELLRIGFLDKVTLKGTIVLNSGTVSEATLMDVYNSYGAQEGPLMNFWGLQQFGMRLPVGDGVDEIIIEEGCCFPSYAYVSGATSTDTRYIVKRMARYVYDETMGVFVKEAPIAIDIAMEAGAAVRVTSDMATSGIRFQTNILSEDIDTLLVALNAGTYVRVEFGTLIVPTDYLMGGQFTHTWLGANYGDDKYLDIVCTAGFYQENSTWLAYDWPREKDGYVSFFGSIVKMNDTNYNRAFSGIGYIKLVTLDDGGVEQYEYIYAEYDKVNSRTASFVANAAINDRSASYVEKEYENFIEDNSNYSPYTIEEHTFLAQYLVWSDSAVSAQAFELAEDSSATLNIEAATQKLAGAYVELIYSTNIDVWGVFTYTDGSKTANEDFYLQQGTTSHKQYLDIFRYNGVGYGMDTSNLSMTSIKFTNAELGNETGKITVLGLYSQDKTIDTANQEIYLTVGQDNGSSMTVGAHLGLGGALTYLAKSGIYEGVIGGSSGWKNGTVAISTDPTVFDSTNRYKSGSSSSSYSTEAGYYGSATGSLPADGAVNLINNFDAGRQIQQSWYAQVGGSDSATDGSNGYTRAYCYTGSTAGQYWPYNPVQAGDVVSNPGQIVDYEINTAKGYIYVKARAMDWAKGYDASKPCENAVEGGVTTKSYVENYYRLGTDGTLIVNNGFIDWNGFTDMSSCDWASTELPAVYPVHTLNYYVSNIDGDGSWTDAIEYNNGLGSWSNGGYHQFTNATQGDTKVEDWFAWANGGDGGAFGMGVYIPNVTRYTSGRSYNSTAYYTDTNFQNSNALPVDNYTEFSLSSFKNVDMVTDFAERGNILADKGMMSNMQAIQYTYQSAYVSNTSYTAPGVDFRMEAYVPIEYSYVICLDTVTNIRSTFKSIKDNGTVTNAGNGYEKVGLDAWARADKKWTW